MKSANPSKLVEVLGAYRQPPRLVVLVEYEEAPRIKLYATGADDRARLLGWLERSGILERLPSALDNFLEEAQGWGA